MRQTYVFDELVPEDLQAYIEKTILEQPWKLTGYNKKLFPVFGQEKMHYAFASVIVDSNGVRNKNTYDNVSVPLIELMKKETRLQETDIILNRCFLHLPIDEKNSFKKQGVHIDNDNDHYVMLYYVTDSDGDTIIYEQTKYNLPGNVERGIFDKNIELVEHARIPPKKGRIVLFDGSRWHCGSNPKDSLRCVLNFNLV